jgi:hypothetical protein
LEQLRDLFILQWQILRCHFGLELVELRAFSNVLLVLFVLRELLVTEQRLELRLRLLLCISEQAPCILGHAFLLFAENPCAPSMFRICASTRMLVSCSFSSDERSNSLNSPEYIMLIVAFCCPRIISRMAGSFIILPNICPISGNVANCTPCW